MQQELAPPGVLMGSCSSKLNAVSQEHPDIKKYIYLPLTSTSPSGVWARRGGEAVI